MAEKSDRKFVVSQWPLILSSCLKVGRSWESDAVGYAATDVFDECMRVEEDAKVKHNQVVKYANYGK